MGYVANFLGLVYPTLKTPGVAHGTDRNVPLTWYRIFFTITIAASQNFFKDVNSFISFSAFFPLSTCL